MLKSRAISVASSSTVAICLIPALSRPYLCERLLTRAAYE